MEIEPYPRIYDLLPENKFEHFLYLVKGEVEYVVVSHWKNYTEPPDLNEPPHFFFKFFTTRGKVRKIIAYRVNGYVHSDGAVTQLDYDEHDRIVNNKITRFKYDALGNRHLCSENVVFLYDVNRLIKFTIIDKNNNEKGYVDSYSEFEYDSENYLSKIYSYSRISEIDEDTSDACIGDLKLHYTKENTRICNPDGSLSILVKVTFNNSGETHTTKVNYNLLGHVSSIARSSNYIREFEYIYDNNGNWVRLIIYALHKPDGLKRMLEIIYREIKYF